jgi:hypothetical protein
MIIRIKNSAFALSLTIEICYIYYLKSLNYYYQKSRHGIEAGFIYYYK